MQVSPLRVQDVRLDYDNSQIYVSATLLDRSPPDGKKFCLEINNLQ